MAIATRSQLRSAGQNLSESIRKSASALSEASDLFLAHSSQDKRDLLYSAIKILQEGGASVYADFLDPEARQLSPSKFGAFFIKTIRDTGRLVVLLTEKTATSRWVPWELGLAHGVHTINRTAVWPIKDDGSDGSWAEQEYFLVYPRIERVSLSNGPQWGVRNPSNGKYWTLRTWLDASNK